MARQFNGWTMAGSAPIGSGMSTTNRCTIAMWMWVDNFNNPNGQIFFETGAQYDLIGTHGFACYANNGEVVVTLSTFGSDGTYSIGRFPWPPNSTWLHWAVVVDRSQTPPISVGPVYINAVPQTLALTPGADSATFPNETFFVFARNNTTGFTSGHLFDMAIWGTVLTTDEIISLANGSVRPDGIQIASLIGYWPIDGTVSPEPGAGGTSTALTLVGSPPKADNPLPFAIAWT